MPDYAAVDFNLADVEAAVYHLHLALESEDRAEAVGHIHEALEALGDGPEDEEEALPEDRPRPADPHDYPELPGDAYAADSEDVSNGDTPVDYKLKEYAWGGPIVFEGLATGDNRYFRPGAIQWDEDTLPWAFRWQKASTQGHSGAVPIGRLDSIERQPGGVVYGRGVIIPELNEEAAEYLRLMEAGVASGVSVDGDSAEFDVLEDGGKPRIEFSSMRLRSLTAVDIPAFDGARISLVSATDELARKKKKSLIKKMWAYNNEENHQPLVAAAIPVKPPVEWFLDPKFDGPTPINVSKDGAVSGHLALFNTCHIAFPGSCVTPPRNSKYTYFHTGEVETQEGDCVDVGHLTFNTGHASMSDNAAAAASHYDHTGTVAADVRCGEDKHGIWVAGALRSTLSDEDIRMFRAAPLSGDWRRIGGKLELVGALAVNVPGFPVPRVRAMVASGETETLITFTEEDESFSDYEFHLRFDKRVELDQRLRNLIGESFSDYELQLRFDKKLELAQRLSDFLKEDGDEDKQSSTKPIPEDDLPELPSSEASMKKGIEDYVASDDYNKEQLFEDLKKIRELLDDSDEDIPAKTRKELEQLYKLFVKTDKNGKRNEASGLDLDEFYAHLDGFKASGLDNIEEFYNACHDSSGRFCPTSGGSGTSGASRGPRGGGDRGPRRDGGGDRGPRRDGGGTGDLRNKAVTHLQTYRSSKKNAARWAAVAAVATAVTKVKLVAGVLLPAVAQISPLLASPAVIGILATAGIANSYKNLKKAKNARQDYNRTLDRVDKLEKAGRDIERIRKEANKP